MIFQGVQILSLQTWFFFPPAETAELVIFSRQSISRLRLSSMLLISKPPGPAHPSYLPLKPVFDLHKPL